MLDSVFVGITASYKFEGGNSSREVGVVDLDREQAGYFCSKEKMELMTAAANGHRPYSATLKHDKQGFYGFGRIRERVCKDQDALLRH